MLQWNMDESYFGKPGFVGIGGVLRYHKVMVLGPFSFHYPCWDQKPISYG